MGLRREVTRKHKNWVEGGKGGAKKADEETLQGAKGVMVLRRSSNCGLVTPTGSYVAYFKGVST